MPADSGALMALLLLPDAVVEGEGAAKQRPHLLGGKTRATRIQGELDAVGDDEVAPDLDRARSPRTRRDRRRRTAQQVANALQRDACLCPLADLQQLLEMLRRVV